MTDEGIDARARVLLDGLLQAVGPSSYERPAAEVWREAAREFADVRGDALGSSFATVNAGGGPRVALVGHIDEIGLVVKHIDPSGVLFVGEIGTWDPAVLVGQRVTVATAAGPLPGVMGKAARHLLSEEERKRVPQVHDLWVDIGALDRDDAASAVQIGDPIVMAAPQVELRGRRLASRALDNRLGALVVLEAARRAAAPATCAPRSSPLPRCARRLRTPARARRPSPSTRRSRSARRDPRRATTRRRPARVAESPARLRPVGLARRGAAPGVADRLIALAGEADMPCTMEAEGSDSGPTATPSRWSARVSLPPRGDPPALMHSPSETV